MNSILLALVEQIQDEDLRAKVLEFLKVPDIELNGDKLPFDVCPGGAYMHHYYTGGLIEHTLAVTRLSLTMCDLTEDLYGGKVNRDYVLAGALLHDIFKCYSYIRDGNRFRVSPLGEKVDHLTLGTGMLIQKGFPLDVVHIIVAHHGDKGPTKPRTIESLIVSLADLADSEYSRLTLRAAEYLKKESTGRRAIFSSAAEALELIRIKSEEGWEGVHRLYAEKDN